MYPWESEDYMEDEKTKIHMWIAFIRNDSVLSYYNSAKFKRLYKIRDYTK